MTDKKPLDRKKYFTSLAVSFATIVLAVAADLLSKSAVESAAQSWPASRLTVIDGFFSLHYVTNTGAAFSMGAGCDGFYAVVIPVTFGVLGIMLAAILWRTDRPNMLYYIGLSLMFSGALGNLIDRMALGYVRDFLDFIIFGWDFAVFNVADACLCVGVALFIVWMLFFYVRDEYKKEGKTGQE